MKAFVSLFVLAFAASAANAQGLCSMQTIAGTYVGYERGSSAFLNLSPQPNPPTWTAAALLPFVNISEATLKPDGTGEGFFWIWAGSISASLDPIPVEVTITEMNADCTGKFTFISNLPGLPPMSIEERFIAFDNGREIQSVPTVTGIPGVAWIGVRHRISNSMRPPTSGGMQTSHGTYLMNCENYIGVTPTIGVADTFLLLMEVSMTGDYTAKIYEKLGDMSFDGHEVSGKLSVNPDLSFTGTLFIPDFNSTINERGVFFNEGHDFYAMAVADPQVPTAIKYSFCQGTRIGQ